MSEIRISPTNFRPGSRHKNTVPKVKQKKPKPKDQEQHPKGPHVDRYA